MRWRHNLAAFFRLSPLYFLIPGLIMGGVSIYALRANNLHMEQLKRAVYTADQNNGNVEQALINLQAYVTSHMNTSLILGNGSVYPPIQLQYSYLRATPSQSDLYTQAQNYCQQQDPTDFSGRNRVPCIEAYVTSHGNTVSPALFQFDFVSPSWSPDLAGYSLIATTLLFIVTFLLVLVRFWRRFLA